MHTGRSTTSRVFAAVLCAVFVPALALGFPADFFDPDVSGNATYEAMAIHPEAVFDPVADATYVVYQGMNVDPYVAVFHHDTETWDQPVRIGSNPLSSTNGHGGPSLVIDSAGYLHVFYGGHASAPIRHSVSVAPRDASAWTYLGPVEADGVAYNATYPQPILMDDGEIRLFFRMTDRLDAYTWGEYDSAWGSVSTTDTDFPTDGEVTWSSFEPAVFASSDSWATVGDNDSDRFYASFSKGVTDTIHAAFVHQEWDYTKTSWNNDWGGKFWRRQDLFYVQRSAAGVWSDVTGTPIPTPPPAIRNISRYDSALVTDSGDSFTNQVVVRDDGEGRPVIIYLEGPVEDAGAAYSQWSFVRWTGSTWATGTIAPPTDHLFDAGTISVTDSQTIDAYLTRGTEPTATAGMNEARGGHLERWRTLDGGASWSLDTTIAVSPDAAHRYNNPQLVREGQGEGLRIAFSEWDVDLSNFVHKAYLWGEPGAWSASGFVQREFTPEIRRVAGATRLETAVRASQESFPNGADTVLVANKDAYPDALCGVPLARALGAPILLVDTDNLPDVIEAEIARLGADDAIILGGEAVVSPAVRTELAAMLGSSHVDRLAGPNRYATSAAVADAVATELSGVTDVVFASGESFPDALCVSPVAARQGWPILLVGQSALTTDTVDAYRALGIDSAVFVGGSAAISEGVRAELIGRAGIDPASVERLEGSDRYATGYVVAKYAQTHGLGTERFVMATGEDFADALTGGVLADRMGGVLLITRPHELSSWTGALLQQDAWNVIRAYVMGGEVAVSPDAENALAGVLLDRQDP